MKKILFLIVALAATLNMSAQGPTVSLGTAKPVVYAGEDTYWRTELLSLLAEVKGYINMLDLGEAQTKLNEAYNVALAVSAGGGDYEKAYTDLRKVFHEVLINQLIDLVDALDTEITNAKTALGSIAYEDKYNELGNEITKAEAIRDGFYLKTEFAVKDIAVYENAKTTLVGKVTAITASDYAQAHDALVESINHAEVDILPTLSLSNLISAALSTEIETAKGVLDAEPASTAIKLKEAADGLNDEVLTQVKNYEDFDTAKGELNTKIGEANDLFSGISTEYAGIRKALEASIGEANTAYSDAANKTTEVLTTATKDIVIAIDSAVAAKEVAGEISMWITNALATLTNLSKPNKEIVNDAIAAAREALETKSTAEKLKNALKELIGTIGEFIAKDVADACEELSLAITNADYTMNHELAYDQYKSELDEFLGVAQRVLDNPDHTATEVRSAAETLNTAAYNIATNDADQALTDLTNAISEATTLVTSLESKNTSIAAALQAVLDDANEYASEGTGVQRKSMAAELTEAIATANSEAGKFDNNVEALNAEIAKVEGDVSSVVVDGVELEATHTGIQTALLSAKSAAQTALDEKVSKTNLQLEEAISALQDAIAEAKTAEGYANNLDALIRTAETAQGNIVDEDENLALGEAIAAASALKGDETKKSTDYEAAYTELNTKMDLYVKNDIDKANQLLTNAIADAGSKKEIVAYEETKELIQGAINLAVVPEDAGRSVIDGIREELKTLVATIVAEDLAAVKTELGTAKANAEDEIAPYRIIANNINTTFDDGAAKSNYENVVINTLDGKIYEAGEFLAEGSVANGSMMKEKADEIVGAIVDMKDDYTTLRAGEKDNFTNVLFAEQDLANGVTAENNVIVGYHRTAIDAGIALVDEIFGLHPETCTYDIIINARIDMEEESKELSKEFKSWKDYCSDLGKKITEARIVLAGLEEVKDSPEEVEGTIGKALHKAINTAETALGDKMNRRAEVNISSKIKSMRGEYETLVKAINTANTNYSKQYWDFADATTEFKKNKNGYAVEHVRYTRSNEFIKEDKYGTFCMPMDIMVDYEADGAQFKHVYVPEDFAILNPETNILKLFLTEKKQGDVISAGTPFFAQLACEGELVLKNSTALEVLSTSPSDIPTVDKDIRIYNQSANSSFVTKNEDIKYVWKGTFQKLTGDATLNKFVGQPEGDFRKAVDVISPFRAYFEEVSLVVSAKSIEAIELDFGDGSETTGIRRILMGASDGSQIFSIDGKKMGNGMNSLNKGVYIINGKKVLK